MATISHDLQTSSLTSVDGTVISYERVGRGTALVIVHGSATMAYAYRPLARALANTFTVITMDRRGRGASGPQGPEYSIMKEAQDIRAVIDETSAQIFFGHSYGGFASLQAALNPSSIRKLVLYEPAVSLHGSLPHAWLPGFEAAGAKRQAARAFAEMVTGLKLSPLSSLPRPLVTLIARIVIAGKGGREWRALMPTIPPEIREVVRLDSPGERYATIDIDTLLLGGSKSPTYLTEVLPTLTEIIPYARYAILDGLDHNAPDLNAPQTIANEILRYASDLDGASPTHKRLSLAG